MPSPYRPLVERLLGLSIIWGAFLWMTNTAIFHITKTPEIAREAGPGMALCFFFMLIPLSLATHKVFNNRNYF